MIEPRKLLFSAFAAGLLVGCGASPAERLANGDKALSQNRFDEARREYLAVLQQEPANGKAMEALVRTYLEQDNAIAAQGMLDRMASAGVAPADGHILRAEAGLMQGRYRNALRFVEGDDSAEAWSVRALAQLGLQKPDLAEEAFKAGMKAKGNRARLLAQYANTKMGENKLPEAKRLAAMAVREDPRDQTALLMDGAVAMVVRDYGGALKRYERALKVFPESREALLGKIGAMAEMGWIDHIRPLIIEARTKDPGDTAFLYLDARLAAEDGKWERVRSLLQPYETALGDMPAANAVYAQAQLHLGQAELARTRLSSQLLRFPGDRRTIVLLGEAKLAAGDYDGALETLKPVAEWPDAGKDEKALLARARRAAGGG